MQNLICILLLNIVLVGKTHNYLIRLFYLLQLARIENCLPNIRVNANNLHFPVYITFDIIVLVCSCTT